MMMNDRKADGLNERYRRGGGGREENCRRGAGRLMPRPKTAAPASEGPGALCQLATGPGNRETKIWTAAHGSARGKRFGQGQREHGDASLGIEAESVDASSSFCRLEGIFCGSVVRAASVRRSSVPRIWHPTQLQQARGHALQSTVTPPSVSSPLSWNPE